MTGHVDERLFDFASGTLPPVESSELDEHLGVCAACRHEVEAAREALALVPLGLAPLAPPSSLRARVLAATEVAADAAIAADTVPRGFDRFIAAVARLLDVGLGRARALLHDIPRPERWVPGFTDDITLYHLDGGPATVGAVTGFVRVRAGAWFPQHRHLGHEVVLVIQGTMIDDDGAVYRPGDETERDAESSHTFAAAPDEDLVYLVVLREGVEVGSQILRASDPRL